MGGQGWHSPIDHRTPLGSPHSLQPATRHSQVPWRVQSRSPAHSSCLPKEGFVWARPQPQKPTPLDAYCQPYVPRAVGSGPAAEGPPSSQGARLGPAFSPACFLDGPAPSVGPASEGRAGPAIFSSLPREALPHGKMRVQSARLPAPTLTLPGPRPPASAFQPQFPCKCLLCPPSYPIPEDPDLGWETDVPDGRCWGFCIPGLLLGPLPTLLPGSPSPSWPRILAGPCRDPHQCPSSSQPLALAAPSPASTL